MKKILITIATATIGGVLATLISHKLLKIDLLGIICNLFIDLIGGNIIIPKWFAVLTILLIIFLAVLCFSLNHTFFSVLKWIFAAFKNKKIVDIDELIKSKSIPENIRLDILGYQNDDPSMIFKKNICIKSFKPGTFTLADISPKAKFMKDPTTFPKWFDFVFNDEIEVVRSRYPRLISNKTNMSELKKKILGILECKTSTSESLKYEVWYQEYTDIIRRILLLCIKRDPDYELDLYPNLTYKRKKIIFQVINFIEKKKNPSTSDWLNISIAAGLLGVDEKSIHSATSDINKAKVIPLNKPGGDHKYAVEKIGNMLWTTSQTENRIDASQWFFQILKLSTGIKFRMVSFPDDYIETILLLKFYSGLLEKFLNLEIDLVPRSIRCGNDASYEDVVSFLKKFSFLKSCDRFRVHKSGPKLGTVNLQKLDLSIMTLIEQADLIEARGARNYEMMQGINKDICFGFMVCRDFSESVTGMKAEDSPLIFLKQSSGKLSFSGFQKRHKHIRDGIMFCPSTVVDEKQKFEGGHLSTYSGWSEEKKDRYELTQAFYTKNALDFHKKYGDHLEREVKEYLNEFKGDVLVIGCGSGKEVNYLEIQGCSAMGIDFSFEAISIARSLYPRLSNQFVVEDLYNIEYFKKDSFDGIISNAGFVHLLDRNDLRLILRNIKKILKKDGIGFLRIIEKRVNDMEEYDKYLFNYTRWFVYYSLKEIEDICTDLELTILKKDRINHIQHKNVYWISILFKK